MVISTLRHRENFRNQLDFSELHIILYLHCYPIITSMVVCLLLFGCSDQIKPSSFEQAEQFNQIPVCGPALDLEKIVQAQIPVGPYRVKPGDVLEISIPTILFVETTERLKSPEARTTLLYRVNRGGGVMLPIIGQIDVSGLNLHEIEQSIAQAYYKTGAKTVPGVFVRLQEYKTYRVTITGAVEKPGVYDLPNDQMSLVSLIMLAGGITERGASIIRIIHTKPTLNQSDTVKATTHQIAQRRSYAQIDPQLKILFRPQGDGHTLGTLTVLLEDHTLLSESLDLTNNKQMIDVIYRLSKKLPKITVGAVENELRKLPNVIHADCVNVPRHRRHKTKLASLSGEDSVHLCKQRLSQNMSPVDEMVPSIRERTIVLPVRGLNIPFVDAELQEGDRVTVEPLVMPMFTVIGLVNNQGNYNYPPGESYTLMEAIGFARGLDRKSDPRYAVVYRLMPDGNVAHTSYDIRKATRSEELPAAMNVLIRPGDIVDIAQTPRTRTRAFLADVFRITIGAYVPVWDGRY